MWRYLLPPLLVGYPLLIALAMVRRDRRLRHRAGSIPVHVRPAGTTRWIRGHALWVHDVLAFHASPAAWSSALYWVAHGHERAPTSEERWWMHRLGGDMVLGTFVLHDGDSVDVAARREYGHALRRRLRLETAA